MVGAPDTSVLVVGAGPTGLLLAAELRRRDVDCVVVDAYDAPLGWDRATVVHPRSLQIFESLGAVEELLDAGVHIRASLIYSDGRLLATPERAANRTRYPFDIGLSEETTERVLTNYVTALGGAVTRSTRLVGLEQADQWVTATVEHGGERRPLSAAWVVGCDGYRSTVRAAEGIAFEGVVPDSPWAVFDAGLENWAGDGDLTYAFLDDPLVILTPLPGRRFRVYTRPPSRAVDLQAITLAVLDRYWPAVGFTDVRNPAHFLCHSRVADRFRSGRVLLAGDAAHACSPAEGHGMNTGLQDAYNLGWKLSLVCQGRAGEVLLDSYEIERRPVALRIVESGVASDSAQSLRDEPARIVRDKGVTTTFSDPDSAYLEAAAEAEVDRDYTGSPIVVGRAGDTATAVTAGRLLPITDPVYPVDGPPRPLHELAHRTGHTLLVLGAGPTTAADVGSVLEAVSAASGVGFIEASYGFATENAATELTAWGVGTVRAETARRMEVTDLTVLAVRPDRYVGLRWDGADPAGAAAAVRGYIGQLTS